MNEIMIAVCDICADDCGLLRGYLNRAAEELNRKFQICSFQTGSDFLKKSLPIFDVVFLHIGSPDTEAEKIIQRLRSRNLHIHLVLLSDCTDFISMGYQYGAKNHLVKPVSYRMILNEMKKYMRSEPLKSEPFLWISNRNGYFKLYLSRLRYAETENRYLLFHYNGQMIRHVGKISDFKKMLPETTFFRCNNSYIVNLYYISHIFPEGSRYNIHLVTGEVLPLSRSRYRELLLGLFKIT